MKSTDKETLLKGYPIYPANEDIYNQAAYFYTISTNDKIIQSGKIISEN
jgi:hypothetical protein